MLESRLEKVVQNQKNSNAFRAGLEGAASAFVEGEVDVDGDTGTVTLSKILDWYKEDFGSTPEERLKWLLPYLPKDKSQVLAKLIKKGKFTIQYSKYDWAVNE